MKKVILSTLFLIVALISFSQVKVEGYYRKDGTYVQPHYRSNPDGIEENNWSYPGNVNPYTGRIGGTNQYVGTGTTTNYTSSYTPSYTPSSSSSNNTYYRNYYPSTYNTGSYPTTSNSYKSSSSSSNSYSNGASSSKKYKLSSTVIVTTDVLNVRSYASTNGDIKYKLKVGEKVVVVDNFTDGWVKVKYLIFDTYSSSFKYDYGYISTKYIMLWSE